MKPTIPERKHCPRKECQSEWGEYRTLKISQSGTTIALCHDWLGAKIENWLAFIRGEK